MAERFALLLAIREQLYAASLEKIGILASTLKKEVKPEELDRSTLIEIIEDVMLGSEKDEDKGVAKLSALKDTVATIFGTSGGKGKSGATATGTTPTWKRELKIQGVIGDPKTGVSFLSLVRQIETATSRATLRPKP